MDFTSLSCAWCRLLTHLTHHDAEVDGLLREFACVKLIAEFDLERSYERIDVQGFPCTMVFASDGNPLGRSHGFSSPSEYVATLRGWLALARKPKDRSSKR